MSVKDYKRLIHQLIPTYITLNAIQGLHLKDDILSADLQLFDNNKGLSTLVHLNAKVANHSLHNVIYSCNNHNVTLDDAFMSTILTDKVTALRNIKQFQGNIIIGKSALKSQLRYLTDESQIDDVIKNWEKLGQVHSIDSDTFASPYSLNELIAMSNLKPYQEDVIANNLKRARQSKEIIPKAFHTNNFETKVLSAVKDGKTTDGLETAKQKVYALAISYCDKKFITNTKLSYIAEQLQNVTNINALSDIYNDLQRYLR